MAALGSAKDPEHRSRHLARLLEGLPVTVLNLEIAGVSTPVIEGGEGPPIVLLHGLEGFAEEWRLVIPQLTGGHRVVVPDLPGLGRSRVLTGDLDAASMVDWLRELIEQTCGDRRSWWVTHSVEPLQPRSRSSTPNASAVWCSWTQRRSAGPTDHHLSRSTGQLLRRVAFRKISTEQLAGITIPVSMIWGTGDRLMRFKIAERASERLGWPLLPIDDCGHGPHIERPGAFLEALETAMVASV